MPLLLRAAFLYGAVHVSVRVVPLPVRAGAAHASWVALRADSTAVFGLWCATYGELKY